MEFGEQSKDMSLPPELATLYGRLQFPAYADQPLIIGNFVTTLDGVVALNETDHVGGGEISGFNQHDRMVMGLLRAVAARHRWGRDAAVGSPAPLDRPIHLSNAHDAYQELRTTLGKPEPPLNVVVTARGDLNLALPVFQSGEVPALIVTSTLGA